MLSPIVPHIAQVLWEALGHRDVPVVNARWPEADASALVQDSVQLIVQVNGKMRGKINVPADAGNDSIIKVAMEEPNVQRFLEGKTLRKQIVVPGRLINLVVG